MTLRERIEAVFCGKTPDTMVWFGDLTYWYDAHSRTGGLPEKWRGERGIGKIHREYNVGEYVPGCRAYNTLEGEKVRCEISEDKGVSTRCWHTPIGTLKEKSEFSSVSMSWGILEHAVKDAADLRILRYIMENRQYIPCPEEIRKIDRAYGDYGLPVLAVPGTPVTELNKTWVGVMELCYLLADEKVEVEKTLDVISERQERLMRITGEDSGSGYVMICENLSGDTMGGYFDDYMREYLTIHTGKLHSYGKKVMIHIDGALRGALDKIAVTGIDCVDAVTPKPAGDVELENLRRTAGPDILLLGGIPGAMFAPPFDKVYMEKHVRELIRLYKGSGKFMLGIADQIPPDGDITLVKLISGLVEEYGCY
ncbi:MAG: hypothetical protein A2017_11380 [Lentisphaerae bacterium GWF2_44_16]|nr:MAG: hypothetical protein A2017_11380 [Lentisphaerae bacterium GWF2_44_16]